MNTVSKECMREIEDRTVTDMLETFKVRLDGALSHLVKLEMSLLIAGGLKVLSNPNYSVILLYFLCTSVF